ncbi:citramalate synthase [Thermobifida fusca]|jgi:2-isopropylmalate synthase|uniref:Citramalate synthase n=2 Tax=Thermobifida fusca TaxID=2021 RepID=A0A9P2WR27_THEFU|nr:MULTISPECIES: citramalate synthase [Thermobifida]AAZ54655.1 2-isopropylmalate synthase [Thermobifida fusca YX]EOR72167.1 putative alpha-isopropylmalate/homocitrate synthase family transferase [Thermobifida fusca TM51]MBO2529486.1 citramalate synthase [Thermobifida sp.]MDD6792964.1 citramalate synthase [Thermobifida fusca]PPS96403.1 transferase [Thermobifida fusca]
MLDDSFHVFDTTLRDGAQREGINFTVADKLAVAKLLDEFGVGFIEGGWPGANPKDTEFFRRAQTELSLKHAQLTAFGSTRRAGTTAAKDPQVLALRDSGAPVVTLVAKSDDRHVELALRTTLEENLEMIADTVSFLLGQGQRVFVDCEHFFDGYRHNPEYALRVVRTAAEAGASVVVLCDTNGGMLPSDVFQIVSEVREATGARLGIHAQDDSGCAVANTLAAVDAGATHVQCTANGYGERVGNANLFSVVPALVLKRGRNVLPEGCLREMTRVSQAIAEIANIAPATHQPYVGISAFAHKAGLHASAIKVDPDLYQHIDPALVGNDMRMLVSDMAGRASVELKAKELGVDLSGDRETLGRIVERVKDMEMAGYSFEAADASLELLLREEIGQPVRYFEVESWRTISERRPDGSSASEATVKLYVKGERVVATGEGNGPVNALDRALRSALESVYPDLATMELVDYKVRILEGTSGTDAVTRVLIDCSDGQGEWTTVGVGENVIEASWTALEQALTYGLLRRGYTQQ